MPSEQNGVIEKTRELCQTILEQPDIVTASASVRAFMNDDQARAEYQALMAKGQALHEKQERSIPLGQEEIADYESQREKVLGNPVSHAFLDAQQTMQEVRHAVNKYVSMALESGRVPTEEDFQAATCGHGCNCH